MMHLLYSAVSYPLTPVLRAYIARRKRRGKEDTARLRERFGRASVARPAGTLIWLHAASVGETQSVLTLVRALLNRHPNATLLVTTGTVTSAALVAQQQLPRVIHQFIPIDTHACVRRFLRHWKPDLALWVESEFWPQLLWQARARRIPLLLINARISGRSFANWNRWGLVIRSLLRCFTAIYAGSHDDAERLRKLGAKLVIEAGNLKFDAAPLAVDAALLDALARVTAGRTLWVAASTHANEEQMVAQAHSEIAAQHANLLTILVPRHATRGDAIAADLRARGFTIAQRSKNEKVDASTQIYLADTMGELGTFYRLADIVFLGGSLVAHGGHNPLEPARLRAALITGPHVHNFAAIMDALRERNAIRTVADAHELALAVSALLAAPEQQLAMADAALDAVESARGASVQILSAIDRLLLG